MGGAQGTCASTTISLVTGGADYPELPASAPRLRTVLTHREAGVCSASLREAWRRQR